MTEKINKILEKLEDDTSKNTGVIRFCGGFAKTEILDKDNEYFNVELKWGVQSDCENTVHTEQYKINRKTFEIEED